MLNLIIFLYFQLCNYYSRYKKLLDFIEKCPYSLLERTFRIGLAILPSFLLNNIFFPDIFYSKLTKEHLRLECTISISQKTIFTKIVIDTEISEYVFIFNFFVQTHDLPVTTSSISITLEICDKQLVIFEKIICRIILGLSIGMNCKNISLLIICL